MKKIAIKTLLSALSIILFFGTLSAQIDLATLCDGNGHILLTGQTCIANTPISPFLTITPDARHAGMGNAGISTSSDANALYFNSSKLAFAERKFGFSANYTPLFRDLGVGDVYLLYLSNYVRLDDKQAISAGLRYLDLGHILIADTGSFLREGKVYEYEAIVSYNRKLGDKFAAGLAAKYIYSQLPIGQEGSILTAVDAQAVAGDLSLTYKTPLTNALELMVGSVVKNLGSKMAYTDDIKGVHLPTNLGIGSGIKWEINDVHSFHFALDINRLIVPRPSSGFAEKMRENRYSFGTEYRYKRFAARIGHLNEHKMQGGMKTLTYGIGFNRKFANLNLSYLHTLDWYKHPMNKTLRVSLVLDFGEA